LRLYPYLSVFIVNKSDTLKIELILTWSDLKSCERLESARFQQGEGIRSFICGWICWTWLDRVLLGVLRVAALVLPR
jgi:hypothetical protein